MAPSSSRQPLVVVGAIARDEERRLLVIRRATAPARGRWTVPGGRVEAGERLADAVVRETREETGLEVRCDGVLGVFEILHDDFHAVSIDHVVTVVGGEIRAGDDADAVAWMGRGELEAVNTTDGLLAFLDEHGVEIAP